MMLPTHRSPIDLPPPSAPLPAGQVTTTSAKLNPPHSDYNLQPLPVSGLDHYVVQLEQGERFRVS